MKRLQAWFWAVTMAGLLSACTGTQEALPPKALAVATEDGVGFVQTVIEDGAFQGYAPLGHTLDLPADARVLDIDAFGTRDRTLVVLYEHEASSETLRNLGFFAIGRVAADATSVTYPAASTLNLANWTQPRGTDASCATAISVDPSGRYVGVATDPDLAGCSDIDAEPEFLWFDRNNSGKTLERLWDAAGADASASAPGWLDLGGNVPDVTWAETRDARVASVDPDAPRNTRVELDNPTWGTTVDYSAAGRVGLATDGERLVRIDWTTGVARDPIERSELGLSSIQRVRVEPNLPSGTFVVQTSFGGYLTDLERTSRRLTALSSNAAFTVDTLDYLHALNGGGQLQAFDLIDPLSPQSVTQLTYPGVPVGVAWFFTQTSSP